MLTRGFLDLVDQQVGISLSMDRAQDEYVICEMGTVKSSN